jgi:cell division protein FtsX
MNASEGLKRIAQVIRWIGYFLAFLCVLGAINGSSPGFLLSVGAIFGLLGWAIAWIIDGFAEKK